MGIHESGVTMKYCRLLLLSLYLSLPSVFSLKCPRLCPAGVVLKPKRMCTVCKTVVTTDCSTKEIVRHTCGCPVCAKAEGEDCNGLWGIKGKCASFLTCKLQKPKGRPWFPKRLWDGVCVKNEVKEEMKKSFWQKIMDFVFSRIFKLIG